MRQANKVVKLEMHSKHDERNCSQFKKFFKFSKLFPQEHMDGNGGAQEGQTGSKSQGSSGQVKENCDLVSFLESFPILRRSW